MRGLLEDALDDDARAKVAQVSELEDPQELRRVLDEHDAAEGPEPEETGDWRFELQIAVVERLAELGSPAAVEQLARLTRSGDRPLAIRASSWLARGLDPAAIPALRKALEKSPDPTIRANAALGLVWRGDRESIPAMLDRLRRGQPMERAAIARALAEFADRSLEGELRRARRREWRPWIRFMMPRRVSAGGKAKD